MVFRLFFCFATILLCFVMSVSGQSVTGAENQNQQQQNSLNQSSQKVIQSISENKSDDELAEDYYNLAMELIKTREYDKAESYLQKAIQLASGGKKKSSRLSTYYRELAILQETMGKNEAASASYTRAFENTSDKTMRQINSNDARRVQNKKQPEIEIEYLQQNADLLNSESHNNEKARAYVQIADANMNMNQSEQALVNYQQALDHMDTFSDDYLKVKSEIANIMLLNSNYDEAIEIQKQVVQQSQQTSGIETQISQMQQLSTLYFSTNNIQEGIAALQQAYELAIEKGNLKGAASSLEKLTAYYESGMQWQEAIVLYKDFLENLDSLIAKDNSLVDFKLFEVNEDRISELEHEKKVQAELISRTGKLNLLLTGSVILLLILLLLIVKGLLSIRKRNKKIALQSLRREMNPHFIYNSLNSINQFIASNNELEANKYLASYSSLMRKIMEHSNNDYIPLSTEIQQIREYLDLEKLRFGDKFDYEMFVDDSIDTDSEKIPNMLIQPNLENAVWHGLRYRNSKGLLVITFSRNNGHMYVEIDDDGIGIEQSKNLKTNHQKMHHSRGLTNVRERIKLLNDIYNTKIQIEIKEKSLPLTGVKVKIAW